MLSYSFRHFPTTFYRVAAFLTQSQESSVVSGLTQRGYKKAISDAKETAEWISVFLPCNMAL